MILKNHIAYRFLTDETLIYQIMEKMHEKTLKKIANNEEPTPEETSQLGSLHETISPDNQNAYYITDTIMTKTSMLKVKTIDIENFGKHFDWSVFFHIKDSKYTFIFNSNIMLRLSITKNHMSFCYLMLTPDSVENTGEIKWDLFHINKITGMLSSNFNSKEVTEIEEFIYNLFCFFFLSDNELIIVEPGKKYGNRKQGKLINTFKKIPVTIVNSSWNITSIRTEEFGVRGHFAIRWSGKGRKIPKMVFIEPFKKNGYIRKAKNLDLIT